MFLFANTLCFGVFADVIGEYEYFSDFENGFGGLNFVAGSSSGTPGSIAKDPTDPDNNVYLFHAGNTYTHTMRQFVGRQTWEFDYMFEGKGMYSKFQMIDKNQKWAGFSAFEVKDGQLVTTTGKTYYLVPDELYHVRIEFDPSKPMMETYVDGVACSTAGTEEADISLVDEGVIRSMASDSIGRIIFVADKTAALTEDIDPASVWCWYDNLTITYPAPSFNFPTVNSDNTVNVGISEFPFYCTRAIDSTTLKNITISKNGIELMYGDDFEVTFDGDGYYISNTKLILKTATQNGDKYIVTFKNVKDFLPFGQTTYTADQKIEFNAVSKLFVNGFTERTGLAIDNEAAVISGVVYGDNAQSFINDAIVNEGITVSIADNDGNDVPVTEDTVITENLKLRLSKDGTHFDYGIVFKDALLNYTFTGATADNHLDNTQRAAWKIAAVLPNAAYGQVFFYDYGTTATDNVYISGAKGEGAKIGDDAMAFNFNNCLSETATKASMQLNAGLALSTLSSKGMATINIKPGAERTMFNFRTGAYNKPSAAAIGKVEFRADGYLYFNSKKLFKYSNDLWYNIAVLYDINDTQSVASLFVNGVKAVDKVELKKATPKALTGLGLTHEANQTIAAGVSVTSASLFDDFKLYEIGSVDVCPNVIAPALFSDKYIIDNNKVYVKTGTTAAQLKENTSNVYEVYNADGTAADTLDGTQRLAVYKDGYYIAEYHVETVDFCTVIDGIKTGSNKIICMDTEGILIAAVYDGERLSGMKTLNLSDGNTMTVTLKAGEKLKLMHMSDLNSIKPMGEYREFNN